VSLLFAVAALVPWISWAVLIFGFPLWVLFVSIWLFMKRETDPAVATHPEPPRATVV